MLLFYLSLTSLAIRGLELMREQLEQLDGAVQLFPY